MSGSFLFVLEPRVPLADAEMSLHLAMFAVEGLAGRVRVRLDCNYQVDGAKNAIVIDSSTHVGQMITRVFAGLLLREFGEDAFHIERVNPIKEQSVTAHQPQEVHA
jgi:hypothetical protein